MRIRNRQVMCASINDEILLRIQVREVCSNLQIIRLQAIDLLEHRDRFQRKILFAVMVGDAAKARYGLLTTTHTNIQIAQDVERRKVIWLVLDELAVLFYRGGNLPHFEGFFGRAQSLFLIEGHF